MNKNDKKGNMKEEFRNVIANMCYVFSGLSFGILLCDLAGDLIEDDASKAAEEYLESLESNHDLNEKIDSLIEGFTMKEGSTLLGEEFEEYLGIPLDSLKKQRLNFIADELDMVKSQLDHTSKSSFAFETWISEDSLKETNEIVTQNIIDDNDLDYDVSLSFEYGKDYGWVVATDYYQIFDETLNEYVSSYEFLNSRSTCLSDNAKEYENIINGVLKSSLCDMVLDVDSNHVRVVIPNDVKELVKKR